MLFLLHHSKASFKTVMTNTRVCFEETPLQLSGKKLTRMCRRLTAPASPRRRSCPYDWWEFGSTECRSESRFVLCQCVNTLCSFRRCRRLCPQPVKVLVRLWAVAAVSHCASRGGDEAGPYHRMLEAVAWLLAEQRDPISQLPDRQQRWDRRG